MAQGKRVALLIGNSNYEDGKNVSGVKNATGMDACLKDLGFEDGDRELLLDANLDGMTKALARFQAKIRGAEVALFFYSGHGFQVLDKNYLLPKEGDVSAERSLAVNDVLQSLDSGPDVVKLVILDACRDKKELSTPTLADFESAPAGVYQAFSVSPGQLAQSGSADEFSPYTLALLQHIREPGLKLEELFDRVREYLQTSPSGQFPIEGGDLPQHFFFRPPVVIQSQTFGWPHSRVLVFLDGTLLQSEDQASLGGLELKARENKLLLMVSNGKTYHNGQIWGRTEGWSYKLDLRIPVKDVPEGRTVPFEDKEPVPFKDGPHHGQTFVVGRATLFVDPRTAEVEVRSLEPKVAHDENETPFWAQHQEILFQAKLVDLQLSAADLLGGSLNFSLTPLVLPFLDQFLKTGKVLDTVIVDPDKSYVAVRGNEALRDVVQHCMTAEWPDRVRDLRASFTAFFNNRNPRPFDVFADGLDASVRANAPRFGITRKPEDLRVWTSLDDLSPETLAREAQPAATSAAVPVITEAGEALPEADLLALAQESILLPQPGEALVDDRVVEQVVEGVPLRAPVYTFLTVKPVDAQIQLHARVIADLSDLQNKIGPLIDTIPLPTDNCSHFGFDNIVARIWGKQITIDGSTATLKLNGNVEIWTCLKNPIQCSKVEWDGLIPKVVWWDCNPPIKNRNASQPFEATLPFQVEVVSPQSYALKLGNPSVDLGGPLGGVTEGILKIAGVDINARVKEVMNNAIRPDTLQQTLPDFVLKYSPTLARAELLSNSGALALCLEVDTTLNVWQLAELIRDLIASR